MIGQINVCIYVIQPDNFKTLVKELFSEIVIFLKRKITLILFNIVVTFLLFKKKKLLHAVYFMQ